MENPICVLVGLGNPGKEYQETLHNMGRMVVERLWEQAGKPTWKTWQGNRWTELTTRAGKVILFEPKDFMNISGANIRDFLAYFKVPVSRLLVIHDDLDLSPGKVRQASGGGSGGHNGIRSVIEALGTPEFARIRLGIGRPASGTTDPDEISRYVLARISTDQLHVLIQSIDETVVLLIDSYKIVTDD